ncbi:MAG: hypothetical protein JSW23_09425 [Planctomycetota bacterium]|nr:MAG: hypothetical protein JSW23_09425 [Planctomycetota bacterium]
MQNRLLFVSAIALLAWAAVSSAAEFGFNTNRGDGGTASGGEVAAKATSLDANDIVVPTPLSVGIDDLGWKRGWSDASHEGPWRVGMRKDRWMVWEDYESIVYVGRTVGARLQCLFIMCEFDRSNICAEYPTTTLEGDSWDNSALVDANDFVIMDYVKDNAAYIEFGLHGVGHEHWEDGNRTRAEFANKDEDNAPWPFPDVWGHMECYERLIDQYGISFPESFVAPAHAYYYNPNDVNDTGGLMNAWGVKYAVEEEAPYLVDHGLMVLERQWLVDWNKVGQAPTELVSADYCWIGSHWANFIEDEPADNHIAADKWIAWFNMIKDAPDRYLPKNTVQAFSQYLYQSYANITIDANGVEIDNSGMPGWAYELDLVGNLVLKVALDANTHVSSATVNGDNIACYYEDRGYGYIILPAMGKSSYTLSCSVGSSEMANFVLNDGSYNVNKFETWSDAARVSVQMYGTQDVSVKLDIFEPLEVLSNTESLVVNSVQWDEPNSTLVVNVTATDNQGVEGDLIVLGGAVGDLSGEGRVDFVDFGILADQWFGPPGSPSADIAPILEGDGVVDGLDLDMLVGDWLEDNSL